LIRSKIFFRVLEITMYTKYPTQDNMTKKILLAFTIILTQNLAATGNPILVTEATISLNLDETEELFFSFAEGDIIEFSFEMVKGKHLKEIEVFELPNNRIFSD